MRFELTIHATSDRFTVMPDRATAEALVEVAARVARGETWGPVLDVGGTVVGDWRLDLDN